MCTSGGCTPLVFRTRQLEGNFLCPHGCFHTSTHFPGASGKEGFSPIAWASSGRENRTKTEHYLFPMVAPSLELCYFKTKKQMEKLKGNESYICSLESTYWVIEGLWVTWGGKWDTDLLRSSRRHHLWKPRTAIVAGSFPAFWLYWLGLCEMTKISQSNTTGCIPSCNSGF